MFHKSTTPFVQIALKLTQNSLLYLDQFTMHPAKSHDFEWDYRPRAKFPLVQDKPVQFSLFSVFIVAKDLIYGRDSQVKLEPERLNTLAPCYQPYQEEAETFRGKPVDQPLQAKQREV